MDACVEKEQKRRRTRQEEQEKKRTPFSRENAETEGYMKVIHRFLRILKGTVGMKRGFDPELRRCVASFVERYFGGEGIPDVAIIIERAERMWQEIKRRSDTEEESAKWSMYASGAFLPQKKPGNNVECFGQDRQ